VQVRAIDRIELSGAALDNPSLLTGLGTVTLGGSGSAGDVSIFTKQLALQEGGAITTFSAAIGNGGKLTINASEFVKLSGISSFFRVPAGLLSQGFGEGTAGSVVINTPQLSITNGAQISSSTFGSGAAGSITINATKSVAIKGGSIIDTLFIPSRITSASEFTTLEIQKILGLQPFSTGSSGNVEINTPALNILDGGGNIKITTQGILGLKYRDRLTSESDITASSEFGVNGTVQVDAIGVTPSSGLAILPTEPIDPSQQIVAGCARRQDSSFVVTGRGGIPENPSQLLFTERLWSDLRGIIIDKLQPKVAVAPIAIEATALQTNA
jgi:large exoprotein involved in heme utilization and adhesion